ncbi:MAG: 2-oxo acid dehydrogenase subunit E2 [Vicinamibacterales bacterium]|nr:2-oxo acid dehydrogenase subunit E2 [Vicinamibacterales bacterium]
MSHAHAPGPARDPVDAWLCTVVESVIRLDAGSVTPGTRLLPAVVEAGHAPALATHIERALGVAMTADGVSAHETVAALGVTLRETVPNAGARLRVAAEVTPRRSAGALHVRFDRRDAGNRRMRHLFKRPTEPSIYTTLELDATRVQAWLQARRGEEPRLTIEHVVIKAVAEALRRYPDANARLRFGRIVDRQTVSVSAIVSVVTPDGRAATRHVQIEHAGSKSVVEIATEARAGAFHVTRAAGAPRPRDPLSALPDPFFRPLLAVLRWLDINPGRNHFSSAVVSNVGAFGGDEEVQAEGFAPLTRQFPIYWSIALPAIRRMPVARGDAVEVRPVLRLHHTFDHRIFTGALIAAMYSVIAECFRDPDVFLAD